MQWPAFRLEPVLPFIFIWGDDYDSQLACNYRIGSLRRIYRWRVGEQLPSQPRHGADYPDQVKFSASTKVPPMFRRAERRGIDAVRASYVGESLAGSNCCASWRWRAD
jgi:hypothetical protein